MKQSTVSPVPPANIVLERSNTVIPGVFLIAIRRPDEPLSPGSVLRFVSRNRDDYTADLRRACFFASEADARRHSDEKCEVIVPLEQIVEFFWPDPEQDEIALAIEKTAPKADGSGSVEDKQYLVY